MSQKITNFNEKEIHAAIKKKVVTSYESGGRDWKGDVEIDGELLLVNIRFPNPHGKKQWNGGQSRGLANQLQMNSKQYNECIGCTMKPRDVKEHLVDKFSAKND